MKPSLRILATLALLASPLWADVIETKSGARLVGTVVKIDGAGVTLSTDFAGDIVVKQSEVVSVQTDKPQVYRLAGGTVLEGTLASTGGGAVDIVGADGKVSTDVSKIAMSWPSGARDPEIASLDRQWAYEAAAEITGKSGNKEQLGTAFGLRATLAGAKDKLAFYTAYDRQETDGTKSADQFKAGVDYTNNFKGHSSWYVREEGGFDRVKGIDLYNIAAAGLGYDFIKKANQSLTGRAGLAFRYEAYDSLLIDDVNSMGLDLGLAHEISWEKSRMVNRLSYIPTFDDFGNFRAFHESFFETPLASTAWKLRLGISNDYTSEPAPGVDELDTTYFTRFVLSWK
jgi:hypothetical protein